jgi:hypothetical protein
LQDNTCHIEQQVNNERHKHKLQRYAPYEIPRNEFGGISVGVSHFSLCPDSIITPLPAIGGRRLI